MCGACGVGPLISKSDGSPCAQQHNTQHAPTRHHAGANHIKKPQCAHAIRIPPRLKPPHLWYLPGLGLQALWPQNRGNQHPPSRSRVADRTLPSQSTTSNPDPTEVYDLSEDGQFPRRPRSIQAPPQQQPRFPQAQYPLLPDEQAVRDTPRSLSYHARRFEAPIMPQIVPPSPLRHSVPL